MPRPLVVLVSGVTWDGVKGSERHLAEALIEYVDVLWVDPPVSPVTPQRFRGVTAGRRHWRPAVRRVAPRIHRLTPVALPGLSRPGIRATTWPLVRAQTRWAVRGLRRTPAAVVVCSFDDAFGDWGPEVPKVLYGTDDWVAGAELMGQDSNRLREREAAVLSEVDFVFAVTPELADRWRSVDIEPVVLPNGCDPSAYAAVDTVAPAELPDGFPAAVAGVVGQFSDRVDIGLLEAVAARGTGLLLVGPRNPWWQPERWEALVAGDNVHHAGPVPFEELPSWLARVHVGLTPYADTAFNRASFPLKTLEYLAAGRPVVGTRLPATVRLAGEITDVHAVDGAEAFADRVVAEASAPATPEMRARRRGWAQGHSWAARARVMASTLGFATPQGVSPMNTTIDPADPRRPR